MSNIAKGHNVVFFSKSFLYIFKKYKSLSMYESKDDKWNLIQSSSGGYLNLN